MMCGDFSVIQCSVLIFNDDCLCHLLACYAARFPEPGSERQRLAASLFNSSAQTLIWWAVSRSCCRDVHCNPPVGKVDFFLEEIGTSFLRLWLELRVLICQDDCAYLFLANDGSGPRGDIAYGLRKVQQAEIAQSVAPHVFRRLVVTQDFEEGLSSVEFAAQCRVSLKSSTFLNLSIHFALSHLKHQRKECDNDWHLHIGPESKPSCGKEKLRSIFTSSVSVVSPFLQKVVMRMCHPC